MPVSCTAVGIYPPRRDLAGMPEMEDLFLRYKELKKHLKAMKKSRAEMPAADAAQEETSQQEEASSSRNQVCAACQSLILCMYTALRMITELRAMVVRYSGCPSTS